MHELLLQALFVVMRPLVVHVSVSLVVKIVAPHHAHTRNEAVMIVASHAHARYETTRTVASHAHACYEAVKTVASQAPAQYKAVKTVASQASGGHVSPPPQQLPPNVTVVPQAAYEQSI